MASSNEHCMAEAPQEITSFSALSFEGVECLGRMATQGWAMTKKLYRFAT
jgi:hypothetical protein